MRTRFLMPAAAVIFLGCLGGCTGAGYRLAQSRAAPLDLASQPPAGQAKICVLRPQSKILSFTALVYDNGRLVGGTRGESYFCYLAEPGDHVISAAVERDDESAEARVDA